MPKAKAAAERALELDETLAEAHASLARVLAAYEWDWAGAEREFKRAIELNPRYAVAHQWYGGYFEARGRHTEAIAERKLALELDPLSLIINFELGLAFYYARDYDRAIGQFQKTLELDQNFRPARMFLPAAYEQKGMYEEAIAEFKKAIPLKGGEQSLAKAARSSTNSSNSLDKSMCPRPALPSSMRAWARRIKPLPGSTRGTKSALFNCNGSR
jgi:tetratricopeptide (TPR) repeat protein